jgi:hypothetical protein
MDRSGDFPFYPQDLQATPCPREYRPPVQAGLLTFGSSYQPRLPIPCSAKQWHCAAFVPDYSGGPVPDFNGVPYQALVKHLNSSGIINKIIH